MCYYLQLKYATVVETDSGSRRRKRQSGPEFQPIRITPIYDSSVEDLPPEQRSLVKVGTYLLLPHSVQKSPNPPLHGKSNVYSTYSKVKYTIL